MISAFIEKKYFARVKCPWERAVIITIRNVARNLVDTKAGLNTEKCQDIRTYLQENFKLDVLCYKSIYSILGWTLVHNNLCAISLVYVRMGYGRSLKTAEFSCTLV